VGRPGIEKFRILRTADQRFSRNIAEERRITMKIVVRNSLVLPELSGNHSFLSSDQGKVVYAR